MAITKVQSQATASTANATSLTATLGAASTAGTLLLAAVEYQSNAAITPPAGWTLVTSVSPGTTRQLALYQYPNNPGGFSSFAFSFATAAAVGIVVSEWSGAATASPADLSGSNSASPGTAVSVSATGTTAQADELLYVTVGYGHGALATYTGVTTGYTQDVSANSSGSSPNACLDSFYDVVSAVQTNPAFAATASASINWQALLVTLKAGSGAPTHSLGTTARAQFVSRAALTGQSRATFVARAPHQVQARATFKTAAPSSTHPLGVPARAHFISRAALAAEGRATFVVQAAPTKKAGLTVTLAGQDITAYADELSLDIESNLGQGPGVPSGSSGRATTCKFDCYLGPQASAIGSGQPIVPQNGKPALVRQGEVIVADANGTRIFGGYASDLQDKTRYTVVKTQVTASDYWQNLARIGINEIFTSSYDTDIIRSLMQTYAPDYDMSLFNATPNYLFTKLFLRAKTMQEALQKIADTTGFDIWVDAYKRLRYQSPSSSGTAPFAVSDTPDFITAFPCAVTSYEKDDTAIINRVYFYGGKTPSTDFTQDLSPQCNGSNTTLVLAYYPREASDGHIHVTVNGVEQVTGYALGPGTANQLKSQGGTADVLINADAQALQFDVAPPAGAVVTCLYRYESPMVVQVTNQQSYSYFGRWFDGFVSDKSVLDKQTAIQRARILLLEQAYGLEHLELTCYKPGLAAGQLLRIDHTVRAIHNAYIVQSVKTVPLGNGQFEYQVKLGGWDWNLVDVLVQAGRQGMIQDQLTNESEDVVQAYDNPFGLSSTIAITQATRTSGQYYARTAPLNDGHDAYAGLFTITS